MALILELPPDLEARLRQEAEAAGMDLANYAAKLLSESALVAPAKSAGRSEAEFRAFAEAFAQGSEQLPDLRSQTFSRERFYTRD